MLDAAQQGDYAYPAVNVTSIVTINAALKAFADAKSDGIIQFSTGGGQFASGLNVKDAVHGCIVLAEATHRLAEKYDILIGLHTDHCQPEAAEGFLKPLIEETARRRANGQSNLFQSHMLDASILPLEENMAISKEYLELCAKNEIILEVEAGVVGGEEDVDEKAKRSSTSRDGASPTKKDFDFLPRFMRQYHGPRRTWLTGEERREKVLATATFTNSPPSVPRRV